MTWKSHNVVTFITIFALTHDFTASFAGMAGSVFPDKIEGPLWRHWHRKYSHWFVMYLPWVLLLWYKGLPTQGLFYKGLFWFLIGALMHIVEDAICGTIPLWNPRKKKKVLPRLFYTGSVKEYFYVTCYFIVMLILSFKDIY